MRLNLRITLLCLHLSFKMSTSWNERKRNRQIRVIRKLRKVKSEITHKNWRQNLFSTTTKWVMLRSTQLPVRKFKKNYWRQKLDHSVKSKVLEFEWSLEELRDFCFEFTAPLWFDGFFFVTLVHYISVLKTRPTSPTSMIL